MAFPLGILVKNTFSAGKYLLKIYFSVLGTSVEGICDISWKTSFNP